ncbi:MAG: NUDIX hydrolase [Actinobacteria bacterium]|nr:NUDIX hydrolase [Actinomycetota bacterium]
MQRWVVGGALVVAGDGLLLVQNRRKNGSFDWSTPGGVIDDGESMLEGLTREVEEETGLVVTAWTGPVYEIDVIAPGLGWHLRVEAHLAAAFEGAVRIDDPDGIVVDARFVDLTACAGHLTSAPTWVREPLVSWLDERWDRGRRFDYRIEGSDYRTIDVVRL